MMLARCVRVASTSARVASTHSRALYSSDASKATHGLLINIIDGIEAATPPLPIPSTPPVGHQYPPPRVRAARNPIDDIVIKQYSQKMPRYSLYCQSTRNNTIATLMDNEFHPVVSFSGGSCGFKKVNRSSYEAGYQCAVRMFKKIEEMADQKYFEIALYFKGFGQGRDAMHRALLTSEGDKVRQMVVSITDRTPIKIGGTRAKKARRL